MLGSAVFVLVNQVNTGLAWRSDSWQMVFPVWSRQTQVIIANIHHCNQVQSKLSKCISFLLLLVSCSSESYWWFMMATIQLPNCPVHWLKPNRDDSDYDFHWTKIDYLSGYQQEKLDNYTSPWGFQRTSHQTAPSFPHHPESLISWSCSRR